MKDRLREFLERSGLADHVDIEEIADKLPEGVDRREILAIAASIGFGWWVLPIPVKVDQKLTRAERQFKELATTIEESDLRDPQQTTGINRRIDATLESVRTVLNADAVRDGRQVDATHRDLHDAVSLLPGIDEPPRESRTARRILTLEAAYEYYSALNGALEESASIASRLRSLEAVVLYHHGDPSLDLLEKVDTGPFTDEVGRLATDTNAFNQVPANRLNRLLPPLQAVVDQLYEQRDIFHVNIAAQRAYLETGLKFVTGAGRHEQSNLAEAEKAFVNARKATREDIPQSYHTYALQARGLSLGEYHRLLTIRREGIELLITACDPDASESERQTTFNRGLDRLFDAREIVTS